MGGSVFLAHAASNCDVSLMQYDITVVGLMYRLKAEDMSCGSDSKNLR